MREDEEKPFHEQTTIQNVIQAQPAWPPPPRPRPSQGPSRRVKILAIVLASLLVASGLAFVIYATTSQYNQALGMQKSFFATATVRSRVSSQATLTSRQRATAQPLETAQAQILATATAQAQPTATAQALEAQNTATAQAMADTLAKDTSGTPALDDPLSDNSQNNQWSVGYTDNNNTGCNFVDSSYQVLEAQQAFLHTCFADATNFSNFVYQVSMTINSNCAGGIVFRANQSTGRYYLFRIDINGAYTLELYNGGSSYSLLASGTSSAIVTGLDQTNSLTVIASKGAFYLFVNQTYVGSGADGKLNAGQVGVAVLDTSLPAKVSFSDAKVWKIA